LEGLTVDNWCRRFGDDLCVDLEYPRNPGQAKAVVVGLCDVRAADSVRVSFDFDRNGWVVQQAKRQSGDYGAPVEAYDPQWTEVGFFEAWALNEDPD
jgi:hypothetical protein